MNHPPTLYWAIWSVTCVLGRSELSIRLLSILATAGTVLLVLRTALESWGRPGAIGAALALVASPMLWEFGRMANFEPPIIFCACVAFREVTRPAREFRGWRLWLAVTAATACDWMGVAVSGLAAILGFICASDRRHRRSVIVVAGSAVLIALGSILLVFTAWAGSIEEVVRQLVSALRSANPGTTRLDQAILVQLGFMSRLFGLPSLLFAVVGVLGLPRLMSSARPAALQILGWIGMWLTYVLAFPARSISHDFWSIYAMPGVALAAGAAVSFTLSWRGRRIRSAVLALACGLAAVNTWTVQRSHARTREDAWTLGQGVNSQVPAGALLVFQATLTPRWVWRYYATSFARPALDLDGSTVALQSPDQFPTIAEELAAIRRAAERFMSGEFTVPSIYLAVRSDSLEQASPANEWFDARGFRVGRFGGTVLFSRER